jgi:hypothetical protein
MSLIDKTVHKTDVTARPLGSYFGGDVRLGTHSVACPNCGRPALLRKISKRGPQELCLYAHTLLLRCDERKLTGVEDATGCTVLRDPPKPKRRGQL